MKTITILNEKGGVGKTTLAVTLAAGLAYRGHEVLLVDAEEQGHATLAVGEDKYPGLYDLLVRNASYSTVLRAVDPVRYGKDGRSRLYLIGSNVETRNIATSISDVWLLHERLAEIANTFEYCVFDTAPTPSLLHGSIYVASDWIVYPTELEYMSLDGLAESLARLRASRYAHGEHEIRIAGVVPNKYRANTLEHTQNLAGLRSRLGDQVWHPIPLSTVWPEAIRAGVPVFEYAPNHDAAAAAWEIVDQVELLTKSEVLHG